MGQFPAMSGWVSGGGRLRLVASLGGTGWERRWLSGDPPGSPHGCPWALERLCSVPHPGFSVLWALAFPVFCHGHTCPHPRVASGSCPPKAVSGQERVEGTGRGLGDCHGWGQPGSLSVRSRGRLCLLTAASPGLLALLPRPQHRARKPTPCPPASLNPPVGVQAGVAVAAQVWALALRTGGTTRE